MEDPCRGEPPRRSRGLHRTAGGSAGARAAIAPVHGASGRTPGPRFPSIVGNPRSAPPARRSGWVTACVLRQRWAPGTSCAGRARRAAAARRFVFQAQALRSPRTPPARLHRSVDLRVDRRAAGPGARGEKRSVRAPDPRERTEPPVRPGGFSERPRRAHVDGVWTEVESRSIARYALRGYRPSARWRMGAPRRAPSGAPDPPPCPFNGFSGHAPPPPPWPGGCKRDGG